MKPFSPERAGILRLFLALAIGLPLFSSSQTFVGVSSTPADNGSTPGPTVTLVPPGGMLAGDLVVVHTAYRATGAAFTMTTTGGQTWIAVASGSGSNHTTDIFWCEYNGTWAANPVITSSGANGLSAVMYVYRPNNANSTWAVEAGPNHNTIATNPSNIAGITTNAARTVTMAFWSSATANTWGTLGGTSWLKTGLANQYRNTSGSDLSLTAAYNIRTTAGNVSTTSQNQSTATGTRTILMSWFELNDNCAGAQSLTSATSCNNISGSLFRARATAGVPACGIASSADVWYSFIAQTTNPTISLSTLGASFSGASPRIQLLTATCSPWSSLYCNASSTLNTTGLTPGDTYFIRITTNTATGVPATTYAAWEFDICITDPAPANNDCGSSVLLTSSTTCSPTLGNVYPATNSTVTITAPNCAVSFFDDVWYRFVAQTTNPTITVTPSAGFVNPRIQLLSNDCGGTFTSLFCSTSGTLDADFLVPGTTYYLRVYSTTNITAGAWFDICVTDPLTPPPSNDECINAINLLISASCSNIPGSVAGATPSALGAFGCSGTVAYDVWYKFTALTNSSTISLGSAGANFLTPRLQLLSGTCGAMTSLSCSSTGTITYATTAGTTYFVRVYSASGPSSNGNSNFQICVSAAGAPVRHGNSYVNITRKTTGGVVQTGDVLEIRMTINHTSGTFSRLRFVDNLPTYTDIASSAPHDSIKVITNEGLTYKKYQLTAINDAASYVASPVGLQYQIRLNLGFGGGNPGIPPDNTSTNTTNTTGTMNAGSHRPRGGGGMLFAIAYRVVVTGAPGQKIVLNSPRFIYYNGSTDITLTGTPFEIEISNPLTLCSNSIGLNVASEFGGTFGSGVTTNRPTDLTIPISGYTFINNMNASNSVGDGRYAIVKNMSPKNSTAQTPRREPNCNVGPTLALNDAGNCNNRMYGHWYIDGDHSGSATSVGNPPPDANASGGYMLMVNADYVASEIYRQNITNLCPNTYYEFSAWIRNICATCGMDSTGSQFTGTPTAPANGYPGVYPNLSFLLNDVDYYNTGEIDTLGWIKRGFVFQTGPSQTSATFSIRNNSQGGGGNDWVLDDIAVATCFPNMSYSPTYNPMVCQNNPITIRDTVRSFFNNYVEYKWQRRVGTGPWIDIPGTVGTATPTLIGGVYTYICTYTIPSSQTTPANDGDLYRLVVASTSSNLTGTDCSYTDPTSISLDVLTSCGPVLKVDLLSVTGKVVNGHGTIRWVTSKEDEPVYYVIEKSSDGRTFDQIGTVNANNDITASTNSYIFTDPALLSSKSYYRIVVVSQVEGRNYSRVIPLDGEYNGIGLGSVLNPFNSEIQYSIETPNSYSIKTELVDSYGKIVRSSNGQVYAGNNPLSIVNTGSLPAGMYILRVYINNTMLTRKILKEVK